MGKTFRYDPESKKRKGKHRSNTAGLEEPASSFAEGWDWKKGCIDMDWAISRMATRVNCVVNDLIKDELICEGEREDYIAKYNAQLVKLARKYDPSRVGKNGRTSSPLHYLRIIEAGLTSNIRDYAIFRKKPLKPRTFVLWCKIVAPIRARSTKMQLNKSRQRRVCNPQLVAVWNQTVGLYEINPKEDTR